MARWYSLILAILLGAPLSGLLGGCRGALTRDDPELRRDSGIRVRFDAGPFFRTDASRGADAGPLGDAAPLLDAGPAGTDAGTDAGPPPGPCDGVTCGSNEHCDPAIAGCTCDDGFIRGGGGGCIVLPPGDPAGRTQAEVCAQWADGHVQNATGTWTAGPTMCDAGAMAPDSIEDTIRRIAMFRWLAGLPAVPHDASRHSDMMECAHMMSVNNALSHSPPTSWTCYTASGAGAAGRSNIALGYSSSPASIDGYMSDRGTRSLGHRRWILGARLGSVEIGYAGRAQCLGVFAGGGSSDRDWTAFPNQGFAPMFTAQYTWSFQANRVSLTSSSVATVTRVSDGADMPVDSYQTGGGGPPPTVGFAPMGWSPVAGETYRVTISDTSAGDIIYETTPIDC